MLSRDQLQAASDFLWRLWSEGRRIDELPAELRPTTRAEGYAVQALVEQRSGKPLFGWKIAATSAAGQAHINVDGPLAGRLLAEKAFSSGAALPFGANHMRVAEAEFAFRMARDLPPRAEPYRTDEVTAAIGTLHPAIEIPDSRYDDFTKVGAAQLIADNGCAHLFVLGEAADESWREIDLVAHPVRAIERRGHARRKRRQGFGRSAGRADMAGQRAVRPRDHASCGRGRDHRHVRHTASDRAER